MNTIGYLIIGGGIAVGAWVAAMETLRFRTRREVRRQVAEREAAHLAARRTFVAADRAACARVDLLDDDVIAMVCRSFEPDFEAAS